MNRSNLKNNHKVGIYLRISRKDKYNHTENESIENQRDDIEWYLEEHPELEKVREYIDDGKTGQNYNRADFVQLEKDIEKGIIDTIITKDLSRLGRDHIQTGQYVQIEWTKKGVRYIAVEDDIDTSKTGDDEKLIDILASNDKWSATTSKKVKRAKEIRAKRGSFQGFVAPYGYKKKKISEIEGINRKKTKIVLIEDIEVSQNVKDIFNWYVIEDIGTAEIARKLNEKKIIAPCKYLDIGFYRGDNHDGKWSAASIISILENEMYTGKMIGLKTRKVSYKTKDVYKTKKEEQEVVKDTHIPLISQEMYDKAQEKIKNNLRPRLRKHDHKLKGLLYCAECKGLMTLRTGKAKLKDGTVKEYLSFGCSRHNCRHHACSNNSTMRTTKVYEEVLRQIKSECQQVKFLKDDLEFISEAIKKESNKQKEQLENKLNTLTKQIQKIDEQINTSYEDKLNGMITTEMFIMLSKKKNEEKEKLKIEIDKINDKIEEEEKNKTEEISSNKLQKLADKFLEMERPSKELLNKLVELIYFTKDKKIEIKYRFKLVQYITELKKSA